MNSKQKVISSFIYSSFDSFINLGIQFIVGIVLARLLSPRDFGLIGMLTVFIAISQSFIDSGFTSALIRKNNCSQEDYSTVFYFNILIGIILYLLLFLLSPIISNFFKEPTLRPIIQVIGLGLILNSTAIIQRTILTKELNFKLQMRVSFFSSFASGILSISLAFLDFGIWSLVALTLSRFGFTSILLWVWSKWRPILVFCKKSFSELFSFGSKMLVSGLIDTIYQNIFKIIIGKFFSAIELGYYSQADQFQSLPSQNIYGVVSRVSFPVLSKIQNDTNQLKTAYKKLIKSTMMITFVLMIGLAAIAKSLILFLIGSNWLPSVVYLQMLCFVGMFYPLHALNLNMLQVLGRSDLFLRLEIIKKIIAISTISLGVFWGIKAMIAIMFLNTLIAFYLNSSWSGRFIGYSTYQQIKDILPSFCLAFCVGMLVFLSGYLLKTSLLVTLIIQILVWIILTVGISELLNLKDYKYIKDIIVSKLHLT